MKRYIRSSKKDDLIREKAAWQMKYDARKRLYDDQSRNYHNAKWDWKDSIETKIRSTFSAYLDKLPDFKIYVDSGWGEIEIRMSYEHLHNEAFSLNWDYRIRLKDNGDIIKESSSWSGLQAVTAEQINDLMNSVNFLKALVDFDWAPLLEEAKNEEPQYNKYVGVRDPNYDSDYKDPGYDKMIREAEIDEAVTSGKWIKGKDTYSGSSWYFIVSQTPKYYNVYRLTSSDIKYTQQHLGEPWTDRWMNDFRNPQNVNKYSTEKIKKEYAGREFDSPITLATGDELLEMYRPQQ